MHTIPSTLSIYDGMHTGLFIINLYVFQQKEDRLELTRYHDEQLTILFGLSKKIDKGRGEKIVMNPQVLKGIMIIKM